MRKTVWGLIVAGLFLIVGAGNSFAVVDDWGPSSVEPSSLVLPNGDTVDSSALWEEYQKAYQNAANNGDPSMVQQLSDNKQEEDLIDKPTTLPKEEVSSVVAELPFDLLDVSLDADQDGLSDADEIRIATKPNNPDSDEDGYIDSLEVLRGYNPLVASPGDKISYRRPQTGPDEIYRVTGVRLGQTNGKDMLTITGTGPNNSLVAILGFKEDKNDTNSGLDSGDELTKEELSPVAGLPSEGEVAGFTWIVRTDKTGRFYYVSADSLDPGVYTVYAASISANGLTAMASEPLTFKRTNDALIKINKETKEANSNESREEKTTNNKVWYYVVVPIVAGIAGLLAVGALWLVKRKKKKESIP